MLISVFVKPGSKKGPLVEESHDGNFVVFLAERAVDGKANQALIGIIAERFGCRKSEVSIKSGHGARHKILELPD